MQEPDTSTNSKVPVYHGVDRCSPKVAPSSAGTAYAQNENHGISTAEDGNLSNTLCTATHRTAHNPSLLIPTPFTACLPVKV